MTERLILTLALAAIGFALFTGLRALQMRRATHAAVARGKPAILYFRSDACAPCKTQARFLQEVKREWGDGLLIEKVDADADPEAAQRFGVFTLPTTLVVDAAGKVRHANYGLAEPNKLAEQLRQIRA